MLGSLWISYYIDMMIGLMVFGFGGIIGIIGMIIGVIGEINMTHCIGCGRCLVRATDVDENFVCVQEKEIRSSNESYLKLGEKFSVSINAIWAVKNNLTWKEK